MRQFIRQVRDKGLRAALRSTGKAYVWLMSPNYRQNQARFKDYSALGFFVFVLLDYVCVRLDSLIGVIENVVIGQHQIQRSELTEYTIRLLRADLFSASSVVYAFGVSRHIETEEDWARDVGCTVHLFDPTEPAIEFMARRPQNQKLPFDPIGVWTETKVLKFYKDKRDWTKNLSVVNFYHSADYIEAPCFTLSDIMKKYGHDHIDVLKMDIEGSALYVLTHMLTETAIRPTQIVGSLERPHLTYGASLPEIFRVIHQKGRLFKLLHASGYRVLTHLTAEFTAIRDAAERGTTARTPKLN